MRPADDMQMGMGVANQAATQDTTTSSIGYMPALDGLRALAMLAILVFHAVPAVLPGGFFGVDIFFVLSGFLITAGIVHQTARGEFSFREFYARRVQRLIPNAALTILVTVLLWFFLLTPSSVVRVARLGLTALFGGSNIYLAGQSGGYWGDDASSLPLLHTWALSVEIQFYVVFPLLLWFLLKRSKNVLHAVLGLLVVLSLAGQLLCSQIAPGFGFYMLPTRAWQFLLGAVLALPWVRRSLTRSDSRSNTGILREIAGWLGLLALLTLFALISSGDAFQGLARVAATLATVLVIVTVIKQKGRLASVLSWRPAVALGKVSYSLFLWHLPLIVFGRTYAPLVGQPGYVGVIVGTAAGVVVSIVAYWLVEKPLRSRGRGRVLHLTAAGVIFALCLGVLVPLGVWRPTVAIASAPTSTTSVGSAADDPSADDSSTSASTSASTSTTVAPTGTFDQVVFRGFAYDSLGPEPQEYGDLGARYSDVYFPPAEQKPYKPWLNDGIVRKYGAATPEVVVIGSSHAMMYAGQLDDICKELSLSVSFFIANGIGVITPQGKEFDSLKDREKAFLETRQLRLSEWRPKAVVVVDRWDTRYPQLLEAQFRDLLDELEGYAGKVIWVTQVPVLTIGQDLNLREYVRQYFNSHGTLPLIPQQREEVRLLAANLIEVAAAGDPNVILVRADRHFYNDDGSVKYYEGTDFYYADDDHLAEAGAKLLHQDLLEAIGNACQIELPARSGTRGQDALP